MSTNQEKPSVTIRTTLNGHSSFNEDDAIKAGGVLVNQSNIQSKASEMNAKYTKSVLDEQIKKAKEAGIIIIESTNHNEILKSIILAFKTGKQFAFTRPVTGSYVKNMSSMARLIIEKDKEDNMRKNHM